ncbi:Asp-tRNA(Asn)/Glu-tRNA(Gln) amidotransferase GatCAB subunit A [Candidatus Gracilibacteria bacterium]|nr:MAG: Asp-tRNA(Asn)/Glu-tRNA(Gln) amidotransferase GatCAB subunit A [Candidatus Gracilibacteria bacterium]
MNFKDLSLEELILKIKNSENTKEEIFSYFLQRIKKYDDKVQSFNFVNEDGLNIEANKDSILAGVPIAVKDIFCEIGIPTTCSSKMLENFKPPFDSTVIKKLKEAGFSSLGKVTMDEFAMGSTNETSALKKAVNPWGTNRIPGGSSGGSAASVAAGLAPAALGTDTGGSIRQPASMCNLVGFKPSYGRNSRNGVIAMASSLDCPGTLTKTVKDSALLYEIMNGNDPLENTSLPGKDIIDPKIWETKDLKGYKIGVPKEYFEEGLDSGVRKTIEDAIEKLKELGAEIKEISLPMTKYAIATYYIIMPAEVSTNLSRYDGIRYGHNSNSPYESTDELFINNRTEAFGKEQKRRIILGSYVLSAGFYDAYYKKATQVRTLIIKDFDKAFEEVDAIVSPVCPSVAWKIGEKIDDPLKMYLADAYTIPASLAGLPGISVPAGFAESEDEEKELLPVGLQILTPRLEEQRLFEIANVFEKATNYGKQNPKGFED